jgi:phenylalanyl-tRNA synthetase beta subunit
MYVDGRTASIAINGKNLGMLGEIDGKVLENFKLRTLVAGFEIKLSELVL